VEKDFNCLGTISRLSGLHHNAQSMINLVYDAQALAAPQSFRDGMQAAADLLDAAIYNNIVVNIEVGYGEFDQQALPNQNTSEGDIGYQGVDGAGPNETYSNLRGLLASHETSSADIASVNALPTTTTLNGVSDFVIGSAEAKALGVLSGTDSSIDGFIGMGTNFTGSTLIGGALHEITHAMGRIPGDTALSLFRYTSSGSHDFGGGPPAAASYFSIDGGVTKLADFGVSSDPSDFLNSSPLTPNDPFDETIAGSTLTSQDLTMMDVLGFQVTPVNYVALATQLYNNVLGRAPDPGGLAYWTNALATGTSLSDLRTAFANSGEAQGDLTAIYNQVLGRAPDQGGLAAWTGYLANGGLLANVRPIFANSGEAQGDLTLIYNQVLGRDPDTGGLTGWTGALAGGASLQGVRNAFAHSGEAQGDLAAIFQNAEGRAPDRAELAGMENQLVPPGATLPGVQPGSGFTILAVPGGNQSLTALTGPEEFDFSSLAFGNDTIAGFNPAQDAIRLNHTQVDSFAGVQADMTSAGGGTVITFDASHSITLNGVASAALIASNFRFV
jgi:hypothetical protein